MLGPEPVYVLYRSRTFLVAVDSQRAREKATTPTERRRRGVPTFDYTFLVVRTVRFLYIARWLRQHDLNATLKT